MAAPVAAPVEVVADGFTCTGGADARTCTSDGALTISAPGWRAEATTGTLVQRADAQTLTLGAGWLERAGQPRVRFDSATLAGAPGARWLAAEPWSVSATAVDLAVGAGELQAGAATTSAADPRWQVQDATWTPCACTDGGPPALTLTARSATLTPEVVVVHGGVVRVFGLPVVPLPPARLPLDPDRFRLLLPELGYGAPGLSAALRGQGGVAGWRVTGGPAWRQDRGLRAELAATGPAPGSGALGGEAGGALGWDAATGTVRGAASSTAGVVVDAGARSLRAAWDAAWQSDADYAADYGTDWIRRGAPRTEQRAVLALGPARLALHGADATDAPVEAVEARVRREWGGPGAAWAPRVAFGGVGLGWQTLGPLGEVGMDARASGTRGALHAELAGDAAAQATAAGARVGAAGRGALELPMWTGRLQLWPGVTAEGHGASDAAARGFVGAGTRADVVSGDWLLSASAHAGTDERGLTGRAEADLDGPVHLTLRAGRRQQAGTLGLTTHAMSWTLGGAHRTADGQWLGWGQADLHVGRLRLGGGVSTPIGVPAAWSARGLVGYDDGCTRLLVSAAMAPDRPLPDMGLTLTVRR